MAQAKLNSAVVKINRFGSTVGFMHLINGWRKDEIATFKKNFLETFKIAVKCSYEFCCMDAVYGYILTLKLARFPRKIFQTGSKCKQRRCKV